jgi:hypothetical protein
MSYFWNLSKPAVRLIRYVQWIAAGDPVKFHYRRLTPNYSHYWMPDSDAVIHVSHCQEKKQFS